MLRILWLVPALPLLGVIINGILALFFERPLLLRKYYEDLEKGVHEEDSHGHGAEDHPLFHHWYRQLVSITGPSVVGAAFFVALVCVLILVKRPPHERVFQLDLFTWIQSGEFRTAFSLYLDPLSSVMILVVTGVGFLIHVYSVGYMAHEKGYARYFVYLNLFTFAMLVLVLASNYLLLFVGWEAVGLCSYLLIGYWYEKKSASDAGKKAFIVNRVGDFGFALGMFLLFWTVGSLNFSEVFPKALEMWEAGTLTPAVATAITLLLFVGATGKSAQIPLYVWLPDAMEGPTPVSALIHAATMVTAGVYMVARSNVLYLMSPTTLTVVAVIGGATALFAATIGVAQNDMKRVLAYSTVSQLGYMFLACGVGAFTAGIFHLMTHAFFKALLFLGSGSVMHALAGELDIRKMGGLKKYMPVTFWTFFLATLAISGIPGFSGFFSKDEILWRAFSSPFGGKVFWLLGTVAAFVTAFYMFRMVFLAFFGETRLSPELKEHVHESPKVMTVPLMILAVLSVVGGFVGIPPILGGSNRFEHFLEPVFEKGAELVPAAPHHFSHSLELGLMVLAVLVAAAGIYLAYHFYMKKPELPGKVAEKYPVLYDVVANKYYVDEIYHAIVVYPVYRFSVFLWEVFDVLVVDGIVNGVGRVLLGTGQAVRRLQTGVVHTYAVSLLIGAVILVGYLIFG
ncbi:MAG: NADH-quinone oxidoreductase subunit L [Deltaproteobacteria bacterium]|nr:MAG: NADH-quinone oxidoreductase subunit L [Deltaproteobacteria bacterium]